MICFGCKRELTRRIKAANVYPCFHCMTMLMSTSSTAPVSKTVPLFRKSAKDWKIGSNVQTQKNQLWEIQLEELYELWLSERILE